MKKKVLIIQPILAHYRNSLFYQLSNSKEFDIKIIAGRHIGGIKEISATSSSILHNLSNKRLSLNGHNFIWQKGAGRFAWREKPDIVVLTGVDPHLLSNLYLAILCKFFLHSKIIWWGHASVHKQGRVGKAFRKFFFNLANGIFTYNEIGKKNLIPLINPSIIVSVIKNCINSEEYGFNYAIKQRSVKDKLTILFSGRITKEKRLDILIAAMAILKEKDFPAQCLIIGNGPEKMAAENQAAKNNLGMMVNFLGERYKEDSLPFFELADIFVLPGKVGLSIIHGLSFGLPVITTDQKDVHSPEFEIIQEGVNGDFFHEFDPASLAEKILLWGDKIINNRDEIKAKCIKSIEQEGYTPEIMSQKMYELFRNVSIQ